MLHTLAVVKKLFGESRFFHWELYHRVNCIWQEAENWYRGKLTIEPQTFCGLKEIELRTTKIQRKNQQCAIIT